MRKQGKTLRLLNCLIHRFNDDEVPALGAQLTYYLILSFFPFLIFVISMIGYVSFSPEDLMADFFTVIPDEAEKIVEGIIIEVTSSSSGTLLSFGMLATIWAASNGINAMIKGLNKAYDEEENRPFWKVRGISILATLVLAIVILVAMLMLIFGKSIGQYLFVAAAFPTDFERIWGIVKYLIPLSIMLCVFMLLYRIAPNRKLTFKEVLPGSLFTTLGWIGTSILFSFYVNQFGSYTKIYGSLGGVIVLLIWLYISSIIILMGGEINAALAFEREGKLKKECKTFGAEFFAFLRKWRKT
ncbi:YihY/virulence factor BrkB family protein [Paenibacillus sp. GCM10012307]|uniref:YihY/virulence factor BrkB family protein n=1 Tax=Paenibacillus roseus TaxID=2798579 RepID=A0A934IZC2_9BACL|nr:YihY/virulence factor BrkB family protein [Paenibacillus roseus]MBJ6362011.1 YihY/virulence factor BrkB family protein [Paenibacillus roseus]